MLLVVCDSALVLLVWVMVVGEGCSGWCCFQWLVAVVFASRRVPGVGVCVSWLVPDVSGACVGWLVLVGVAGAGVGVFWLVCVFWWFRMLMCSCLFLFPGFAFLSCIVWLITGCLVVWGGFWGVCFLVLIVPRFLCLVYCLLARVVAVGSGGCLVILGGGWLVFVLCARSLVVGLVAGRGWWCASVGYWVVILCLLARACVRKCVGGVVAGVW